MIVYCFPKPKSLAILSAYSPAQLITFPAAKSPRVVRRRTTLPLPDAAAYAELQQSQANEASVVLMRRGNQAVKRNAQPTLIELAGTPWRIAVWRPVTPVAESVAPYVLGWLVASLVIAILVLSFTLAVRNRVTDNLHVMVKLTNDVRQQRLRADYPVSLAEFQSPLETMLKLGKVMLRRQKEV